MTNEEHVMLDLLMKKHAAEKAAQGNPIDESIQKYFETERARRPEAGPQQYNYQEYPKMIFLPELDSAGVPKAITIGDPDGLKTYPENYDSPTKALEAIEAKKKPAAKDKTDK